MQKKQAQTSGAGTSHEGKNEIAHFLGHHPEVILSDFLEYLKDMRQEENLFFYVDIQTYKKLSDAWARQSDADYLYRTYIRTDARHRINIGHETFTQVEKLCLGSSKKPSKHQFRVAEREITKLLHDSVVPEYMRSPRYTTLVCEHFTFVPIRESDHAPMYVELYRAELNDTTKKRSIRSSSSSSWTQLLPLSPEHEENKPKMHYYDSLEINLRTTCYVLKAFASARMKCGKFIRAIAHHDPATPPPRKDDTTVARSSEGSAKTTKPYYGIRIEPRGIWMNKSYPLGDYAHFFHALLAPKSKHAPDPISLEWRKIHLPHAVVNTPSKGLEV